MTNAKCELCGGPIGPRATFAERVSGWSLPREQGGQNVVRLREVVPDRVAHVECVKAKQSALQGRLM